MCILKLTVGNAVLQQRHMPYRAVSASLINKTRFHLSRTVATVFNQGLGYGFNIKIRVFMHWNEIQGCLVLCFSAYDSFSLLIFCTAHSLPFHSPG